MRQLFQLLLFLIYCQVGTGQQTFSFIVKDILTDQPVENVFIFIENSSVGTSTDPEGIAHLVSSNDEPFNLVITHILYETLTIPSESLIEEYNEILLEEKQLSLEEVTIKSKKVNLRKRKKWMKKFEEGFLGKKSARKKVKILNPEVLWFEESDSLFQAHAIDNIRIENRELGYAMQFALQSFFMNEDEDVQFSGKLFFKDIKDDLKKKSKINESRDKQYLQSKQLFFHSLVERHPVNHEKFEFGITTTHPDSGLVYQKLDQSDLLWSYGIHGDTLYFSDFFTIIKRDISFRSFEAKGAQGKKYHYRPATSFLKSSSGYFVIGRDGMILNPKDIEESGYWTNDRMAKELPRDYKGSVIFNDRSAKTVVENLLSYQYNHSSEKIYLHTDKERYVPYEQMWIKGYLVDAIEHQPAVASSVVYVDLLSPDDKIVKSWMLHADLGLKADYLWGGDMIAGRYLLRSYTSNMRNNDECFFFEKEIELQDLAPSAQAIDTSDFSALQISFFPEGGDLIYGVNTSVTFQAKNVLNRPVEVDGVIVDQDGMEITKARTRHRGLGKFTIKPEVGKSYFLEIARDNQYFKFQLPIIQNSGLSIKVNPIDEENLFVTILSSSKSQLEGAFLIGHVRGAIFAFVSDLKQNQILRFSKSEISSGLVHFTLFDGAERPQAERLIFNEHALYQQSTQVSNGRIERSADTSTIQLSIQLDSIFRDEAVDASMSIKRNVDTTKQSANISSYLLMDADLGVNIPGKEYYLTDITNAKRFQLDLIMSCFSWRRFTWKDVIESDQFEPEYAAEQGYTISGYTSVKEDTTPVQSSIMINTLGDEFVYDQVVTDHTGQFRFEQLPLYDSATYIIQGRLSDGKKNSKSEDGQLKGNRLLDIHLDDLYPTIHVERKESFFQLEREGKLSDNDLFALRDELMSFREQDSSLWTLEGPDVSISASRPFTTNRPTRVKFYMLDEVDWVQEQAHGTYLLNKLAPRNKYLSGPDGRLLSIVNNFQGVEEYVPVAISINGAAPEPGGSNANEFLGMTADQIESIVIGKTFIGITTRDIPRSLERYLESGIIHLYHPGYYKARQFNASGFLGPDTDAIEKTIYWQPKVAFDDTGKATCSIPKVLADQEYHIDLQGVSSSGELIYYSQALKFND